MVTFGATQLITLVTALLMFFTNVSGITMADNSSAIRVGVEGAQLGMNRLTFGITEDGTLTGIINRNENELYITEDNLYLTLRTGEAYTISTQDLLTGLGAGLYSLPVPTEEDAMAVAYLAMNVVQSVSPTALSLVSVGEGFTFAVDVDRLVADLDTAMPQALLRCSSMLDPVLAKYTLPLLGVSITCEQLAYVWPELGLSEYVCTGLKAELTLIPRGDGFTALGNMAGMTFLCRADSNGFDLSFTTPDGVNYQLSSADIMTALSVLADMPADLITPDAFNITEAFVTNEFGDLVRTQVITIDTVVLASNLNAGIARTLNRNADVIDPLLIKYNSWMRLLFPRRYASWTASDFAAAFNRGAIELPEIRGSITITDENTYTTVKGTFRTFLGDITVSGLYDSYNRGRYTNASGTVTINAGGTPVILTMTLRSDDAGQHLTLSSSHSIFGLFSTISFTAEEYYEYISSPYSSYSYRQNGERYSLTTDTDVLRFTFDTLHSLTLKVGQLHAALYPVGRDGLYGTLNLPDFYADMTFNDSGMSLDTPYLGFDLSANYSGLTVNGYVAEDPDEERVPFALSFDYYTNTIDFSMLDMQYGLQGDSRTGNIRIMADGEVAYTIVNVQDTPHNALVEVYTGSDITTIGPVAILYLFTDLGPIALPENAVPVNVDEFFYQIERALLPY